MTETNRIEYKRELTSELDIEKEVVAFLNYKEGGYIYIGIDKDGSTVGVSDVELVESLGSGIPRILRAYGEDCFKFTDNFIRITLPITAHEGTKSALSRHQVGTKSVLDIEDVDKLLIFCEEVRTIAEMLSYMSYSDRTKFRKKYIYPLLDAGIIQMTIPDKPNSQNQKYRLTAKGIALKDALKNNK